jgi:hypothetical protein
MGGSVFHRFAERAKLRENALVYALWALGIAGSAALFRNSLHSHLVNRDFAVFTIAGKLAVAGHAADAYTVAGNQPVVLAMGRVVDSLFLYPPHVLFMAVPISFLPFSVAFWGFQAATAALFCFAARSYLPANFPGLLAVLTPAALINIGFGQVGLLFGALWLWAFSGSALAIALLTFKPHLGFLAAIEAVRRRRFVAACTIALAMIALSALVFGIAPWQAWLNEALAFHVHDLAPRNYGEWFNKMTTPYLGYGLVGWLLFAAAGAALLVRRFDVFTAATATFLITPYGLHYDMTVVCLGFGLLLFMKWRSMPSWQTFVAALAFLSPLLVGLGTWLASPILLAGLYVQTRNPICKPTEHADARA